MRILLTSTASYVPPRGGSTRSNLVWLEHLASQKHQCRVVCTPAEPSESRDRELSELGLTVEHRGDHEYSVYRGIEVFAGARSSLLRSQIAQFEPERVLVSSEDLSHTLLKQAAVLRPVVYLAHTPQFFPFGPLSWNPDEAATEAVKKSAVVVISKTVAAYVRETIGVEPAVLHPPIYNPPKSGELASFRTGDILIVNPCKVKGIDIYLRIADACPELRFSALPGWGTTAEDRRQLEARPNVRLLKPVKDIDEVLAGSSLLLMPSLWFEGFGIIAMEAMARGLPVVSSDAGGLREAKQGTRYVMPVSPIEQYLSEFDDRHMPVPVVPPQDIEPWVNAVRELASDEREYHTESTRSRDRASAFISSLRASDFEQYLLSLDVSQVAETKEEPASARLARLSPEKRAMLLSRLRKS